ncbi:MAG: protease HtpX [Roseiflexus castenholzii]|uniref:zinc metalloprotease HtpX n=1 Tax=Roseiflexus castenholzii TaxID=120962 RepID=UPI000CB596D8|nr:MAG: protease HtpX [Roseiflexus castenholzii]
MGKNVIKLFALMAALTALFLVIGNALGGTFGLIIAVVLAAVMNLGAYWFSDSIVLRMSGAREVSREEAPWFYQIVEQQIVRAGLPMPKLYIIDEDIPNAFATGRSPSKGVVAVTTGISRLLTKDELAGVIAHELAHIKNRDTLISAVTATIAGAIAGIADMWMWSQIFSMFGGSDDEEGGNPIGELLLVIVAPIAATLIQLGISRAREFQADELGARILGDPLPLASALEKIEWAAQRGFMPMNPATASLYIVNPLSGAGGMMRWFSTHPPTEERIARLRAMARQSSGRGALAA